MLTGVDVADAPALSVARAVSVWLPANTLVHTKLDGTGDRYRGRLVATALHGGDH